MSFQPILSDRRYEVDIDFMYKSPEDSSHGFATFLLGDEPEFPEEFHSEMGYRPDYKGLGVFLYRSVAKNKWVSHSVLPLTLFYSTYWLSKIRGSTRFHTAGIWTGTSLQRLRAGMICSRMREEV